MSSPFTRSLDSFLQAESDAKEKVVSPKTWKKAWVEESPTLRLCIRNPRGSATPHSEVNIDFLQGLGCKDVLVAGLIEYAKTSSLASVRSTVNSLKGGFCAYLHSSGRASWPASRFAAADFSEFALLLRKSDFANATREAYAGTIRGIWGAYLSACKNEGNDFAALQTLAKTPAFRNVVANSKSKTGRIKSVSKEAEKFLPHEQLLAINEAVEVDVRRITVEWHASQKMIKNGLQLLEAEPTTPLRKLRHNPSLLLAWCHSRYDGIFPQRSSDRDFDEAVFRGGDAPGLHNISRHFYCDVGMLLPFFLLLLIRTRYNKGTLVSLKWTDIAHRDGSIAMSPFKARANKDQVRSEPAGDPKDPLSLGSVLATIEAMTSRLEGAVSAADRDRVFKFSNKRARHGMQAAASFDAVLRKANQGVFKNFLERHNLDKFQVRAIRPTMLDAITAGFEDLARATREGNHSESVTTLRHYVSVRTSEQRKLLMSDTAALSSRWAKSQGSLDPRHLPTNADLKSATPGFGCLAPMESPLDGETPGRLCSAEGHCARCPNSFVRTDDPKLVAYILAYARKASEATHLMPDVSDELVRSYAKLFDGIDPDVVQAAINLPSPSVQIK